MRKTYAPEAYGEVVWFGRRGAGAKRAIRSAGDGGKRAVLREEHEVSCKAIAQGRPECSRCPVCSCALLFAQIARETAGAASTRSSLRPLISKRANEDANLGRDAPRDRECASIVGWVERSETHHLLRRHRCVSLPPILQDCHQPRRRSSSPRLQFRTQPQN